MRQYPIPRAAVALAEASPDGDELIASGAPLTEEQVLALDALIAATGPQAALGGEPAQKWARKLSQKLSASDLCPDGTCEDVGLYGVVDTDDHNIVYGILRSDDFSGFDRWNGTSWEPHELPDEIDLRILNEESAQFVIDSLAEGCDGAYLHPGDPMAFLSRDEPVELVAAASWDESKYKRDNSGKFAPKQSSDSGNRSATQMRASDMARYIREGGPRPSGVKAKPVKGKSGGSGGSSGGSKSKSGGSKSGASAAKAKWAAAKKKITQKENAERTQKAEADLAAEGAKAARAAKAAEERKALAAEFSGLIESGMDIAEAERQIREKADEQSRALAAEEDSAEAAEKIRKLEYARRMAALREAKGKIGQTASAAPKDDTGKMYAVVDDLDPNAVMALIRLRPGPELDIWQDGNWVPDPQMLADLLGVRPPPLVELTDEQVEEILKQAEETVTAAVSPDPRAARLRAYWLTGKGSLKIRWGTPGDFTRCVRQLRKYLGPRTKGYCANLHKAATGMWPGDRRNRGVRGSGPSEDVLWDAVLEGGWIAVYTEGSHHVG